MLSHQRDLTLSQQVQSIFDLFVFIQPLFKPRGNAEGTLSFLVMSLQVLMCVKIVCAANN